MLKFQVQVDNEDLHLSIENTHNPADSAEMLLTYDEAEKLRSLLFAALRHIDDQSEQPAGDMG